VELSISVGISLIQGCEPDLELAMRRSDIAMYRAKQNSHNRIAIFDQSDDGTHLDTYQLYVDLMQAIRDRQFRVLFQPIVDQHGRIHSLEALSRWQHPQLGMVGPEVFVDLAERYRQMNTLSDELIGLSLKAYRDMVGERNDLRLSLNLPPSKLSDPELLPELTRQLTCHGIPPSNLTIELTERSVLVPQATVTANLKQLRGEGVAISLDDFGTGYSSLSLLSTLQPDEVKIDKSFVMAMYHDDYARQIITLIADMASRMNLQVVAEGVEDGQMLAMLQALGIRLFQGFHFSRPLPVAELRRSPLLAPRQS
jgi:EAL domain-containing protein (putative c-di-GMP-specific phosphodiesterase class I)